METILIVVFVLGYILISLEHGLNVSKAASALITGVVCWIIYILDAPDKHLVSEQLTAHLGELSGILFFLMGAMTIVELIDLNNGFEIITTRITITEKRKFIWVVVLLTFFLSAVLDNLATTIVVVSLLRRLVSDAKERLLYVGMVVIAANAGGAWSPIGDVTTTMLWIGGQVTASNVIMRLMLPSLACLVVPLTLLTLKMKGSISKPVHKTENAGNPKYQSIVLFCGISILILVPIFKTFTHLPPYMGVLLGLGILWVITGVLNRRNKIKERHGYTVAQAMQKIDLSSILFFLGILLSIAALQEAKILQAVANWLTHTVVYEKLIVLSFGLLSAIVDNVPLVAASQGMYSLTQYPTDHSFWTFLAYCTGTGGSALIIGSAAGVAAMGMEKISFFWYLKKVSLYAIVGYFAGALVYVLQGYIFGQ